MKVAALPNPLPACITKNNSPCIFILAKPYAADKEALIQCLKTLSIKPGQIITLPHAQTTSGHTAANTFQQQLATVYAKNPEIQIIPVNVFWGRSPRKVKTVMQATLANSWSVPGRLRRGLFLLMQLRQVSCYFGQAIDLQNRINSADPKSLLDELNLRFNQQKEAVIGPDLSHQRMLSTQILQSNIVKDCIDQLHKEGNEDKNKLEKKAQKYLKEMASDYSYSVVRIFDILLSWLWEKLYQGVEVRGMENVQAVAADHELVYVPCHRSHMDYLLLSYVIFHKGLMPPHIAAGINLNLPIVGSLLRRGGAFFIRRQFRDNKLYRAVLESYVACMCQQGFSMEYFIEGGRSRTGFLLQPKPGMLAMTLRAAQDQSDKPLAFLPVYIAYERLMESHSYINELYGEKKEKESLSSLLSARHYLKEDYGKVFMSIGKPIFAEKIWQKVGVTTSPKPKDGELFFNCVDQLSQSIQTEINNTAYLSPLNLIATALLSSKRRALPESQLLLQLQLLSACLDLPVFRDSLQLHAFEPQAAIEHALKLNVIQKNANALGHIFYLNQQAQVGATFLRNNTLHVFILPAMVASILTQGKPVSGKRLLAICLRLYPYLKSELFLPWQIEDLEAVVEDILQHFLSLKLIKQDGKTYYCASEETETFQALTILSGACKGSIERFYITAELLTSSAKGFYNRSTLELACTQMAERLSLLHEFHAPDFFDKNLFRTFIASLIKEGLLIEDENQNLQYQRALLTAKKLGKYVLSPSVKRSIQQVTQPSV
ncbi:MAG: glycerol-3-phosphate 1-O-acyltransferase PlsB [Pseudomonadales bacterium]|nr:glycerol-3-phosphate 1-O-acyltransferase PlsB [Pseudomonadales bacterium]